MNTFLLLLFIAIQATDVWVTYKGLGAGDEEANPIGGSLFERLGFWPTVFIVKGAGIALAILITLFVRNAYWFTGLLCVLGIAVLWNNFKVLNEAA